MKTLLQQLRRDFTLGNIILQLLGGIVGWVITTYFWCPNPHHNSQPHTTIERR